MKKIIALLLAVLYISTTSGVVLNVHYCMGKVSSVNADNFKSKFCKCDKKEAGGNCCKTEIKVVKLHNDHNTTAASFDVKLPVLILPSPVSLIEVGALSSHVQIQPAANAPPDISSKIYIENCVFRI